MNVQPIAQVEDELHAGPQWHVAHQFDDAEQQRSASTLGMWAFLATEVMMFGGLFLGYSIYRASYPAGFGEASSHLKMWIGAINTGVLLCSSFSMVLAVHYAREGEARLIVRYLLLTVALGSLFLIFKAFEYYAEYRDGLIPGPWFTAGEHLQYPDAVFLFMSFYFVMTGLHATHMIVGLAIIGLLTYQARRGRFTRYYNTPVDMVGLYWHFVDVVWIFLFPLLYLV